MPSGTVVNGELPQEEQEAGTLQQFNNLGKSSNGESSNEKDDGTTCKICKIPRKQLTGKCADWVQCDICVEYVCPKCYNNGDISTVVILFVVFAADF